MIINSIQITVTVPFKIQEEGNRIYTPDILTQIGECSFIKQLIRSGRSLVSYGFTERSDNGTEVVLNFE